MIFSRCEKSLLRIKGFYTVKLERCFCFFSKLCECCCIVHCQISKYLSVKVDTCLVKAVHKLAVRHTVVSCCCIDSGDPMTTEISLLQSSANVCIVQRLHYGFSCDSVLSRLAAVVSFGKFKNFSTLFYCVHCSLNTHNSFVSFLISCKASCS